MTNKKSMCETAFEILSSKKRAVQFSKLWADVKKATGVSDDKVAQFYSDITLDNRFARLKDNKWDLSSRRKYNESHFDVKKIELDDSESEYSEDGEESYDEEN